MILLLWYVVLCEKIRSVFLYMPILLLLSL